MFAAANPRFRPASMTRTPGPLTSDEVARPVVRRVVHDDRVVFDDRWIGGQRRQACPDVPDRVVGDDDYRESRHVEALKRISSTCAAQVRHEYRARTVRPAVMIRARSCLVGKDTLECLLDQGLVRAAHIERGIRVDLSCHWRVEHDDGDACGERLERREAEAFVVGQEHERSGRSIERGQFRVGDEGTQTNATTQCRAGDQFLEVDTRRRPIVTDDLESDVPTALRESGETCDELRDVPTSEERSDVENRRWRGVSGSEGVSPATSATPGYTTSMVAESTPSLLVISRFENSEIVSTRAARRADRRVNVRRRSPSLVENHSGWAANETSWIATTIGVDDNRGAV